jgi:cysteine desulfurase
MEAMEHLLLSYYLEEIRHTGKNHVLTTVVEDAATLLPLQRLEALGCSLKKLPVDARGHLSGETLRAAIKPRHSLLSLSWGSGLTGVMQPMEEIAAVCQEYKIALHVDISHGVGRWPLCFSADFLTLDGALIHAPQESGVLIVKEKVSLSAPLAAKPGVMAALSTALPLFKKRMEGAELEVARLRDRLERGIVSALEGVRVLFAEGARLPHCTTMVFPGVCSEALLFLLHQQGVYASQGGGGSQKLSHVLRACHIDPYEAECALSFSLSLETTPEEIEEAVVYVVAAVHQLRRLTRGLACL